MYFLPYFNKTFFYYYFILVNVYVRSNIEQDKVYSEVHSKLRANKPEKQAEETNALINYSPWWVFCASLNWTTATGRRVLFPK